MMSMRRYVPLLIAGSAFIAAACRDATAPTRSPTAKDLPTIAAFSGATRSFVRAVNDDAENSAETIVFTLSPHGGRAHVRGFTVTYPADAVCDPAVSTYGPTEWDEPCTTLTDPITVTARFWSDNGIAQSEFSPDIRFNPEKTVTLSTIISAAKGLVGNFFTQPIFSIGFTRRVDEVRYFIDDAATDGRLATSIDFTTGKVSRTIQHFSGYFVQWGTIWCEDGSELNDPLCIDAP
jgi:hypothetical protein